MIVGPFVRIRCREKRSFFDEGKDTVTTSPPPPSDIYPKHIKQIKQRKETISSGIMDRLLLLPPPSSKLSL